MTTTGGTRLSRRDLLRGRLFAHWQPAATPAPAARPPPFPILRPPGAVAEAEFLSRCNRCNACVTACPTGCVVPADARLRQAAGTPTLDFHESGCRMCPDAPCVTACTTGALRRDVGMKVGRAVIQASDCLAAHSFCSVCRERCPVPGAITLAGQRPQVVDELCTGCGQCQASCPAPVNAVLILPLDRSLRGGRDQSQ
ncbi:MAG: 4Fe-4S dicluster domain-containing protein [Myxococcota bacterium]